MTPFVSGDYSDDDDESDDTEDVPAVENAKESKGKAKEEQLDNAMADFMAVKVLPSWEFSHVRRISISIIF